MDRLRPQLAPEITPAELFGQEHRDEGWAPGTEAEIAKRLGHLRGGVARHAECRATECRIEISGTTHDLSLAMADLEKLVGFAASMTLTAAEPQADGTKVLPVFLTFAR